MRTPPCWFRLRRRGNVCRGGQAVHHLAAALILEQVAEGAAQLFLPGGWNSRMGDDNRRREVGQLEQGAGRERVQQAAADQGSVEFAEPDQPVELSGLTVETAYLH